MRYPWHMPPRSGLVLRAAQRELRRLVTVWCCANTKLVRTCPVVDNLETGDDGRGWRGGGGGGYSKGQEEEGKGQPALSTFFERRELSLAPPPRQTERKGPVPSNPPLRRGARGTANRQDPSLLFTEQEGGTRLRGFLCTVLEEGHTSENPTLKNDHIQSDGDARLDRRKAISSL